MLELHYRLATPSLITELYVSAPELAMDVIRTFEQLVVKMVTTRVLSLELWVVSGCAEVLPGKRQCLRSIDFSIGCCG